jgi:hypothetical protein
MISHSLIMIKDRMRSWHVSDSEWNGLAPEQPSKSVRSRSLTRARWTRR